MQINQKLTGFIVLVRLSLVFSIIAWAPASAQDKITEKTIQFAKGASSTSAEASIRGYEILDYLVNAREGQYMKVRMTTSNSASYFNIMEPQQKEVAIFIGSTSGKEYEGMLSYSGNYRIRVYLMRSAARRNEVANYKLEVAINNQPNPTSSEDAVVENTGYHATGSIPCHFGGIGGNSACDFGVVRSGNGSGTVTVTRPDGSKRIIFFENGQVIGYDRSEADGDEFHTEKKGDIYIINIGEEHYEIFEAVIYGG